jgi:hypothetical protein
MLTNEELWLMEELDVEELDVDPLSHRSPLPRMKDQLERFGDGELGLRTLLAEPEALPQALMNEECRTRRRTSSLKRKSAKRRAQLRAA